MCDASELIGPHFCLGVGEMNSQAEHIMVAY